LFKITKKISFSVISVNVDDIVVAAKKLVTPKTRERDVDMQIFAKSVENESKKCEIYIKTFFFIILTPTDEKEFTTFSIRNEIKIKLFLSSRLSFHTHSVFNKMKVVLCLFVCLSIAAALPVGEEGANFANEAIKQAQTSHLIPHDAIIQNVSVQKYRFLNSINLINFQSRWKRACH
jgi:hypothetical protein